MSGSRGFWWLVYGMTERGRRLVSEAATEQEARSCASAASAGGVGDVQVVRVEYAEMPDGESVAVGSTVVGGMWRDGVEEVAA